MDVQCYLMVLICIFRINNGEHLSMLIGHLYISFREISFQILCPLKKLGYLFFIIIEYIVNAASPLLDI